MRCSISRIGGEVLVELAPVVGAEPCLQVAGVLADEVEDALAALRRARARSASGPVAEQPLEDQLAG